MALRDEFKKERAALRDKPFKDKFQFFWTYYKWHALIWAIGLVFLGVYIYQRATSPIMLLNGIMLNSNNTESTVTAELANDFMDAYDVDSTSGVIVLDNTLSYTPGDKSKRDQNYDSCQAILSQRQTNSLDFVAGPIDSMLDLAYNSIFADLRTFLTPEEIAICEPYFLYIDMTTLEKLDEAYDNKEDTSSIPLPDCTKPEEMKEALPVMIDISKCSKLAGIYGSSNEILAFGTFDNAPNADLTLKFIQFLMKQEE